jgi:alkanesulfonate monooxygenase SsuD/methylene tetrahydromethanopterin reductase-like flavin-dependent oxidoreductase (luciferase family)
VREAIEIVRAAANGNLKQPYAGEDFRVDFPCAYDWLKSSPAFVYGTAYRQQMMRMEGRVADGVYIGCTPPEIIAPAMAAVKEGVAKRDAGRAPIRVNTFWAWHIKADKAEAYRESTRELPWRARKLDAELCALYLNADEVQLVRDKYEAYVAAWFDRSGKPKGIPESISNRLCEGLTSTGGLDALDREIERFKAFGKAGLTEISLRLHDDPMDALKIIGERVVPELRKV